MQKLKEGKNGDKQINLLKFPDISNNEDNNAYCPYKEDFFHEALYMERKRSQRSKRPFLLVLMHTNDLLKAYSKKDFMGKLINLLNMCSRETDIRGWYEDKKILGLIYTEIDEQAIRLIKQKIELNLIKFFGEKKSKLVYVTFHVYPDSENGKNEEQTENDLRLYPDLIKPTYTEKVSLAVKRTVDIIGSLIGIIIFTPLFILIPLLIKLTSRGDVFFKQTRVGYLGKKFVFLKFRSMYVNNDSAVHQQYIKDLIKNGNCNQQPNGKVFKIQNDSRVTSLGAFLRKTSLDELPQFFNVFKGDMSLVGPRPPIPYELKHYAIWHRNRIINVKPGITGIWQVEGRSATSFDEMVRMDIQYTKNRSFLLDIKLLLKTPLVMLTGKGGY